VSSQLTVPFPWVARVTCSRWSFRTARCFGEHGCNVNVASFDPSTLTFTALNPADDLTNDHNYEENWVLLPDGTVLTVDGYVPNTSQIYNRSTNRWTTGIPICRSILRNVGLGTGGSHEVGQECCARTAPSFSLW